jgi:hypothetical protein
MALRFASLTSEVIQHKASKCDKFTFFNNWNGFFL